MPHTNEARKLAFEILDLFSKDEITIEKHFINRALQIKFDGAMLSLKIDERYRFQDFCFCRHVETLIP
jgi:hypothetical protein